MTAPPAALVVLDASVLIGYAEPADAFHHEAKALLLSAAQAGRQFAASPITLAEFYVRPAQKGEMDRADAIVAELGIRTISLSDYGPRRLAMLRAATGRKLPDCCVLLAAEQVAAQVATFDDALRVSAHTIGLAVYS